MSALLPLCARIYLTWCHDVLELLPLWLPSCDKTLQCCRLHLLRCAWLNITTCLSSYFPNIKWLYLFLRVLEILPLSATMCLRCYIWVLQRVCILVFLHLCTYAIAFVYHDVIDLVPCYDWVAAFMYLRCYLCVQQCAYFATFVCLNMPNLVLQCAWVVAFDYIAKGNRLGLKLTQVSLMLLLSYFFGKLLLRWEILR